MSFDLQQRLEGQVTSQKMRIEELEEEIAQKSQLLDILKSGFTFLTSLAADARPGNRLPAAIPAVI